MKASATMFAVLLASQLPLAASVQAQAIDAASAKREDDYDARRLQLEYNSASRPDYKILPHSVDVVTDTIKTLADGNQIKTSDTASRAYDQDGRVRITLKAHNGKERIFIADLNARTAYLVRPDRQDVLRLTGAPMPYRPGSLASGRTYAYTWSKEVQTNLGAKDFEGYKTAGTLKETYFAPGSKGNDKELVETTENWRSTEYNLTTYQRKYSPLSGEVVTRLENFKAGNPSDALFAIPANYPIRDIVFDQALAAQ